MFTLTWQLNAIGDSGLDLVRKNAEKDSIRSLDKIGLWTIDQIIVLMFKFPEADNCWFYQRMAICLGNTGI